MSTAVISTRVCLRRTVVAALVVAAVSIAVPAADHVPGKSGGVLVVAQTTEPKTFNPVMAADQGTRDVLSVLSADLVHINRLTLKTELALAKSSVVSADGRHYTVTLRDGLRFSDGTPLTADDVVFSFKAYLDERVNSPQRDVLIVDDQPIAVTKLSNVAVRIDLSAPYAPGDRLFDSVWILPKHKLDRALSEGKLPQAWTVGTSPDELAAAGPFRVKQYQPGQRLILERNPYYWKRDESGQALPYLDRLEVAFVPDQNAMLLRLMAREVSAASRLRPEDFARLEQTPALSARDAGASLEYNFLFFNWSAPAPAGAWFRTLKFRQAVARAVDRESIVRLVYQGRGSSLASQVTPGNRLWRTDNVSDNTYDPRRAEQLLREAGFRRSGSGPLVDRDGHPVEFSLMVSATNQARRKMATLIQEDLAQIGIRVRLQPTEFGVMTDAVLKTRKFEGALWGIASGDADPNSEMNVWTTGGTLHVWNLKSATGALPGEPWEAEVDRLMAAQMTATSTAARKSAYDKVQQLISANVPVVFLASPHVLAVGDRDLGNFQPAATDPVLLWNADRLFWQRRKS
jgi:peptide/nickel transport system substrate-binding protein